MIDEQRISQYGPRFYQRLMLPGPRLVLLVITKSLCMADKHTGPSTGTQAHVDFISFSRTGMGGEDVDDALAEAVEKLRAVDSLCISPGLFTGPGMQKNEVKIGAVAELQPTQLVHVGEEKDRVLEVGQRALLELHADSAGLLVGRVILQEYHGKNQTEYQRGDRC